MNVLQSRRKKLSAALAELDKVETVYSQIEAIVKKAGFSSLRLFMSKVDRAKGEPKATPVKPSRRAPRKGKRPRITDEQLAEMKRLSDKDVSPDKIAKTLHVSPQSVYNWGKVKFVRK